MDCNSNQQPETGTTHLLTSSQYETLLTRRAVRKTISQGHQKATKQEEGTVSGDVKLGITFKLIEGKMIVHRLHALEDGRPSPAQLAGVVEPGDALLAVNGESLVDAGLDQLVTRLLPLTSPDPWTGVYQRSLTLRFATWEGLDPQGRDA